MEKAICRSCRSRSHLLPIPGEPGEVGCEFIHLFLSFFFFLFIYFWLHWVFVTARRLFSSCGERGLLFVAARRLPTAVASLVVEHRL